MAEKNMRGFDGAVNGDEGGSLFPFPSMIIQDDEDPLVNPTDAGSFSGKSIEYPNVLVPPSQSEDSDFNDSVLKYISDILMEEDGEKESFMFYESAALQAAEKSLYEVLQERPSPSPSHHQVPDNDQNDERQDENYADEFSIPEINDTITDEYTFPGWNVNGHEIEAEEHEPAGITAEKSVSQSSYSPSISSSSSNTGIDEPMKSSDRMLTIPSMFSTSEIAMEFYKGVPSVQVVNTLLPSIRHVETRENILVDSSKVSEINAENYCTEISIDKSSRKNPHAEDVHLEEGRKNKQPAVFLKSTVGSETVYNELLDDGEGTESSHEKFQTKQSGNAPKACNPWPFRREKSRGKKKHTKRNDVDLRGLLMLCAQAVTADDIKTATEFLKQIREHSSPTGDGMQRLAHYFAEGLEARMSGIGNNIKVFASMPPSAGDMLRAYQLYLAACPFRRVSHFFSNKTIMDVSEKATRLHIIHFGILYGFQWPSLLQRLSSRPGGPPKLRITGIDVPLSGFKPAERVEETGRLLANYAEMYKIPFEFNGIAQNWETIKIEDLKLEEGEVLAVNCLYRMRILYDETVMESSPRVNNPRNNVLNLIRKTNPDVFILGVVNGAYNTPFFITRFREALFHFSSLFDMLESNIPRDIHERLVIEKYMFGRQAINVIACEGGQRTERPETYKQWQVRNVRAGFTPLPLAEEIKKTAIQHVKTSYPKDFLINEDGHWLVQGWRGRTLFALSTWKPAN